MRRIAELDAVRGIAAVVILFFHLWWMHTFVPGTSVDCFFVLSGYLITTIILKYRETPSFLGKFYMRRGLRIWPIYYLTLAVAMMLGPALPNPFPMDRALAFLTYTQNIEFHWLRTPEIIGGIMAHTWTLALEEQFYIIWPVAVLLATRRHLVPLCLIVILASIGARCEGMYVKGPLLARCDGFALGGLLAALLFDPAVVAQHRRRFTAGFVASGLVAGSYPIWGRLLLRGLHLQDRVATIVSLNLFFVTLIYFSAVGLAVCYEGRPWLAPLRDRRLVYTGKISYGLYLYHPFAFAIVEALAPRIGLKAWFVADPLKIILSFVIAGLSWRYIERPILAIKDRFDYRREPRPAMTGQRADTAWRERSSTASGRP